MAYLEHWQCYLTQRLYHSSQQCWLCPLINQSDFHYQKNQLLSRESSEEVSQNYHLVIMQPHSNLSQQYSHLELEFIHLAKSKSQMINSFMRHLWCQPNHQKSWQEASLSWLKSFIQMTESQLSFNLQGLLYLQPNQLGSLTDFSLFSWFLILRPQGHT